MHNVLSRANALLAFTLWVMAAVTAACFLSTVFLDYTVPSQITVKDIKVRSIVDYATDDQQADLATLSFNLKVDFTRIFNWNVKQLFVYLVAEYKSKVNEVNQVVLWDRIVERGERVVMDEIGVKTKYYFLDDGTNLLKHDNVTFVLRYNVIPNAGYLRLVQSTNQIVVPFPTTYSTTRRS
uniref:Signal peptidase complex subunit 3 n=1 Tax=Caenorhabditis tropicalis TaxID=1561998 RepID=A0A1I7URH1_9PELO